MCHDPAVYTEQASWWCPECQQARTTTFTFARRRDDEGMRRVESAVCDRGHTFNPYV